MLYCHTIHINIPLTVYSSTGRPPSSPIATSTWTVSSVRASTSTSPMVGTSRNNYIKCISHLTILPHTVHNYSHCYTKIHQTLLVLQIHQHTPSTSTEERPTPLYVHTKLHALTSIICPEHHFSCWSHSCLTLCHNLHSVAHTVSEVGQLHCEGSGSSEGGDVTPIHCVDECDSVHERTNCTTILQWGLPTHCG